MNALSIIVAFCLSTLGSQNLHSSLGEALQDEYAAQATYQAVIMKFGRIRPFSQILNAEKSHASHLLALYQTYALTPPADAHAQRRGETKSAFITRMKIPPTMRQAARMAYDGELRNIAIYDRLLKGDLPADVKQVFRNLRAASADRHLPAFARAAGIRR